MTARIKDYLLVAKPGIILGNLVSAAAGFFLASKGRVDESALAGTLLGLSLVVASGCVFNNCIDRNMDRKMVRTRDRALARGAVSPKAALWVATMLGVAGLLTLWGAANPLAAGMALAGLAIYVGVYSLYMKRNSAHGALIGSLAGATPPLVGYCAVADRLDMGALILLAIFSFWQMPHCYAIAVLRFEDYASARVPILPVRRGTDAARRHIIGYILAFMAAGLALTVVGRTGPSCFAAVTVLGLGWLYLAWRGYGACDSRAWAKKLFVFSIVIMVCVSVMMSVDSAPPVRPETLLSLAP